MELFDNISEISFDDSTESHSVIGDPFIEKIMRLFLRHNVTLTCLEDIVKLVNDRPNDYRKLPKGKVQILEMFRANVENVVDIFYVIKCSVCGHCTSVKQNDKNSWKCSKLGCVLKITESNHFVSMPIESQIKKSIQDNWYHINNFNTKRKETCSDVHDGLILRNVLEKYHNSDINILSLTLNVDGANKFKSNTYSVWPIQLLQNYLPPHIRFLPQHIIVCGLHYTCDEGELELNFDDFLLPVVDELNKLSVSNMVVKLEENEYIFKPLITHCSVDLPAKSKLQKIKQYGGFNGCKFCEIPGELVFVETVRKKNTKNLQTEAKKLKKFVRYVEDGHSYDLRTEEETLEKMLLASTLNEKESIDGIKDVSCLVALEHFNIIWSMSVEYMHSALEGNTKRLLSLFLHPRNCRKTYYIPKSKRKALNSRILKIKPSASVVRKPRSLNQKASFKASEYRSMLLYYLPICLPGFVPHKFVEHVRTLSAAVYILLKTDITTEELDEAEKMLNSFVIRHQELFGKQNMVMNIHLLKHFVQCVLQLGPLWSHSAFPFERNNGCLLKLVNGTSDVLHQISTKYALTKALSKIPYTDDKTKILLGKGVKLVEKKLRVFDFKSLDILNISNVELLVFKRIRLQNSIYTSLLYTRPRRSIDYFIGLVNGTIGTAKYYVECNETTYVMLSEYQVIDEIHHILKVKESGRVVMATINEIEKKYIFMTVGLNKYVVCPPNPYEME